MKNSIRKFKITDNKTEENWHFVEQLPNNKFLHKTLSQISENYLTAEEVNAYKMKNFPSLYDDDL